MIEAKRHIIFVKHSLPEIMPAIPSNQWRLSEEGRSLCGLLAETLNPFRPDVIVSSIEPKAIESAELVGKVLGLTSQVIKGLHEHERDNEAFDKNSTDFQDKIAQFFSRPDQLVYGRESADQAYKRFYEAAHKVVESYNKRTIVIVAHGTVISLLLSRVNQFDPFTFWKSLGLPSFAVTTTSFRLLKVVTGVKSG